MKFRTEIEIAPFQARIGYDNRTLALGSCFAAHIASRLAEARFRVAANPTGILFNPLSIAAAIGNAHRQVTLEELHTDGGRWFHFGFHGDLAAPHPRGGPPKDERGAGRPARGAPHLRPGDPHLRHGLGLRTQRCGRGQLPPPPRRGVPPAEAFGRRGRRCSLDTARRAAGGQKAYC